MAIKYGKKKQRKYKLLYTVFTAVLICAVFATMVKFFYNEAESEANEMLHLQTKQIKDDLTLQIKSDRENLVTLAHFASKLYADGEDYSRMFDSFEPIGLISNIGILNPDNTFTTKKGMIDLNSKISFSDEAQKGEYISGRVPDLTRDGKEIIRSAVPIKNHGETVGILYGVISLDVISDKYNKMAKELDAQLFVYDKEYGNYIINTIGGANGNISSLKTRKYNDGYTYEELVGNINGFSSFKSIRNGEDLYIHYSTMDDAIGWRIMLARYESQVFEKMYSITWFMGTLLAIMLLVILLYVLFIFNNERKTSAVTKKASEIRKMLLEISRHKENITKSLQYIMELSRSRSAIFIDTDGEEYHYMNMHFENNILMGEDRNYFISELFRYAIEFRNANYTMVGMLSIKPDAHLENTNPEFYVFLNKHNINNVTIAAVTHNNNDNISVLGVINPKRKALARAILEEITVCFSIAIYNKNHLNRTYTAATTDALTNVLNRVAYKKDILAFDEERPAKFSCIYIDVNELHIRNNKFGHAAGDEMLIYIANALKNIFYGHHIYRMGGDEFLVFAKNTEQIIIKRSIDVLISELSAVNYHVAIGVSYREQNTNTEELVREAEIRMYEAKAQYYQNKQQISVSKDENKNYIQTKTGIREIDTMLSVLKEHYNGIYRVSLETDNAHRILMPSYLGYNEDEKNFSRLLAKYINEIVHVDFHRAFMSFLNYDVIKRQIAEGKTPSITYKKVSGESVILSVYNLNDSKENINETLWVFAKD